MEHSRKLKWANGLIGLGCILSAVRGAEAMAVTLLASSKFALADNVMDTHVGRFYEQAINSLKQQLDEQDFGLAWADGCAMSLDQAVTLALDAAAALTMPSPMATHNS